MVGWAYLGRPSPYRLENPNMKEEFSSIGTALAAMEAEPVIDATALVEIVNRGYCFGTRTLVKGCGRSPAAAENHDNGFSWKNMPEHGHRTLEPGNIAGDLFSRLCQELQDVCGKYSRVGLLLSGGMDSRVVACALSTLQKHGRIDCAIVALTWGEEGCRDVEYARAIAALNEWEFRHYPLTPERLAKNIEIAGFRGAEYSPVHLHGLPDISGQGDLNLVLAASFGDSVGRAEFSGTHVKDLKPIDRHIYNRFKLLDRAVFKSAAAGSIADAALYRQAFGVRSPAERNEIDHQLHYMQRMLVPCMEVIEGERSVYQAFTSPEVYGYMWSLSPHSRNDRVYYELLAQNAPELLSIPWARTGRPYLSADGTPDSLEKNNNSYGLWLRTMLYNEVKERVLSDEISQLRTFNMWSLETMLKHSMRGRNVKATQLQEVLAWVASLSEFVSRYGVGRAESIDEHASMRYVDGKLLCLIHAIGFDAKVKLLNIGRQWLH